MAKKNGDAHQQTPEELCYAHRHGLDAMLGKVQGDIDRDGYSILKILHENPYCYTVGLTQSRGHPELFIRGVPIPTGHHLLADLIKRIPDGGRLATGEPIEKLANFPLILRTFAPENRAIARFATLFYQDAFSMLQLVWPDANGRFPWQKNYHRRHNKAQPHYWTPLKDLED